MYKILVYTLLITTFIYLVYKYYIIEGFELKCIVSTKDGNKYCVRDRKNIHKSIELLTNVSNKCKKLVSYLVKKYPNNEIVLTLNEKFDSNKITETLPNSSYTAYSENKGEKIAFCLNKNKNNNEDLIDEHTLTFVAIHELAHIGTKSVGHNDEFWNNFKFLLKEAKLSGIHEPKDYNKEPVNYCGMKIHDNPFYDL